MVTRWVSIDDSHPALEYLGGSWFGYNLKGQNKFEGYGLPYKQDLHGTNTSSSLALSFTGSSVAVYGTNNLLNVSGVLDPLWECFVDGASIGSSGTFPYPENNYVMCDDHKLQDQFHTLTINATVLRNKTFWFDRILYVPSTVDQFKNETMVVWTGDPGFKLGKGWNRIPGTNFDYSSTNGSTMNFDFNGTSLSWYGVIPSDYGTAATTASFTVDNQSSQIFNLRGCTKGSPMAYHQLFFQTSPLPTGKHSLSVVHHGNGQTVPLTLDYVVVEGVSVLDAGEPSGITSTRDTVNPTATTSRSHSTPSTSGAPPSKPKQLPKTSEIVAGVVSAAVIIILLLLIYAFHRRRKAQMLKYHATTVRSFVLNTKEHTQFPSFLPPSIPPRTKRANQYVEGNQPLNQSSNRANAHMVSAGVPEMRKHREADDSSLPPPYRFN